MNTKSPPSSTTKAQEKPSLAKTPRPYETLPYLIPIFSIMVAILSIGEYYRNHLLYSSADDNPGLALHNYECTDNYSVQMLSFDPVIIYLEHFIRDFEIDHLINQYSLEYVVSPLYGNNGRDNHVNGQHRNSKSALIHKDDVVGLCLVSRMRALLGTLQHTEFEPLQLVKYEAGGQFGLHYDWFPQPEALSYSTTGVDDRLYNRFSSVFVYLDDDCIGGETYFPEIPALSDNEKVSRSNTGTGLVVKPKKGNALFWINMRMNGTGDTRVAHAGLPLESGRKLGLNMWSVYFVNTSIIG